MTLYLFLPICVVFAVVDIWQGIPMNFRPYTAATAAGPIARRRRPRSRLFKTILQGPMASYCASQSSGP